MPETIAQIEKDLDLLTKIDTFLLEAYLLTPHEKFPKLHQSIREARANILKEYHKKHKSIPNE